MNDKRTLPRPFILRRLHSLMGLWLVIYLIEHLWINSQAALFWLNGSSGFIAAVDKIHHVPYLKTVEILFLGLPFFIHGIWGIIYAYRARLNSFGDKEREPVLPQYRRNRAHSWQRITSWLLIVGILAHVVHMRFLEAPHLVELGEKKSYLVPIYLNSNTSKMVKKMGLSIYDSQQLKEQQLFLETLSNKIRGETSFGHRMLGKEIRNQKEWLAKAKERPLKQGQVLVDASSAGRAFLLIVRQTFQNPLMVTLYSLLVIASCYHAFNGLWTLMITWGVSGSAIAQDRMKWVTTILMAVVTFLGLAAIWGSFLL